MNRWVLGARPRTLPAAVVPVLVGTATAAGGGIHWWRAGVAMVVALAIQVATNYANDYADGVRGTDDVRVGPVRLVASRLASAAEVKRASLLAGAVAAVAGLTLVPAVGPEVIVIGAASLAAGYLYTGGPRPYGYAGLGEVFVFLFFGVVATVGSSYVQLDRVTLLAVAASVPVGFLVVNNLRDIRTDGAAGKRTLAVRVGEPATRALYGGLVVGAFLVVPVLALRRPLALLALLAAPLAARPLRLVSGTATARALLPALADTARLALVFGVLLAAGLALSA
jgi:1,4-dihydroxy-2-naphthoate octaprenyltransferase